MTQNEQNEIVFLISKFLDNISALNGLPDLPDNLKFVISRKVNILIVSACNLDGSIDEKGNRLHSIDERDNKLRQDFLKYIKNIYANLDLLSVNVELLEESKYSISSKRPDCVWFIFNSDRYELRSSSFESWSRYNQSILDKITFYGFSILNYEQLDTLQPAVIERKDEVVGKEILVSHIWVPSKKLMYPDLHVVQKRLLSTIIVSLICGGTNNFWANLTNNWDDAIACFLGDYIELAKSNFVQKPTLIETALNKTKYFFKAHSLARKTSDLIEDSIALSKELDEINSSWDFVCRLANQNAALLKYKRLSGKDKSSFVPFRAITFAKDYQFLKQLSIKLLDAVIEGLQPNQIEKSHEIHFNSVRKNISGDLHFILFGGFSSGKSTFINTYVKLSEGMKDNILPVDALPETAVITIIKHGKVFDIDTELFDQVDLKFFSLNKHNKYLIHRDEIKAFQTWIDEGLLFLQDIKVNRFYKDYSNDGSLNAPLNTGDLDRLKEILFECDTICNSEFLLKKKTIHSIDNIRFRKKIVISKPSKIENLSEFLKNTSSLFHLLKSQPNICLRVEKVILKAPLKSLESIIFADTPGTESTTPQHHRSAINYIKKQKMSPVIYLFNDGKLSNDDSKNIDLLLELKGLRIFYVANVKIDQDDDDEEEPHEYGKNIKMFLNETLKNNYKLYLANLHTVQKTGKDRDWDDLMVDVNKCINSEHTDTLRNTLMTDVGNYIETLIKDYKKELKQVEQFEAFRKEELKRLKSLINTITSICLKFDTFLKITNLIETILTFTQSLASLETNANDSIKSLAVLTQLFMTRKGDIDKLVNTTLERLSLIGTSRLDYLNPFTYSRKKEEKLGEMKDCARNVVFISDDLADNLEKANTAIHLYLEKVLTQAQAKGSSIKKASRVTTPKKNLDCGILYESTKILSLADETPNQVLYLPWLEYQIKLLKDKINEERTEAKKKVSNELHNILNYYLEQLTMQKEAYIQEMDLREKQTAEERKKQLEMGLSYLEKQSIEYQSVYESFKNY